ncbi:MAG: dependent oxidoreductase family protein [Hydrocarboniphaga sp.]|uniref:phytoene desaturase family protein n=1 Tax=Hydrocarboniphaga sp. TaxID=2033016 RepID=UPI0026164C46|nr:NAD(P)/FAD-dependent oxidoreductase [Hydrocarboniphaga sp.]MDB5968367.1 dependent oxidoreductase family protein [Hydrocarboniphaga sp.]
MNQSWDYIVIGAGHNGLTAACTLAKAGRSVLVVEQRAITGGLSVSHPFVTAAPNHHLSIGAMDDALMGHSPMIDFLGLRQYGYDSIPMAAPYGWMGEDGETLLLHNSFDRTVEEIKYFSPRDAQTYIDVRGAIDLVMGGLEGIMPYHPAQIPKSLLIKMALKAAIDRKSRKVLGRMLSVNAFEMIAETFESEAMRGLWAFWACMFAPATVQASGVYLAAFGSVHRAGIFRPVGGMSGMIRAMEGALTAKGGEIRCNHKVEQLLLDGKRIKGVRIVGGQELFARHAVLANCAPQVVLGKLLPASVVDEKLRTKIDFIPANSVSVAPFKIDYAVGGRITYKKAVAMRARRDDMDVRKTTFMTGTLEQHIAQHKASLRGEPVDFRPPLYFSIMSANDASIAPKGQDVFYLYVNTPINPIGGWDACKTEYSQQIRSAVSHYVDGLDLEIGSIEHCPKDFEEQFGAPNGAYFHVDMIPSRMLMNRPAPGLGGYKTPFGGLYLAGAGSHPSGGVCGWPGRLAAETAMHEEGASE